MAGEAGREDPFPVGLHPRRKAGHRSGGDDDGIGVDGVGEILGSHREGMGAAEGRDTVEQFHAQAAQAGRLLLVPRHRDGADAGHDRLGIRSGARHHRTQLGRLLEQAVGVRGRQPDLAGRQAVPAGAAAHRAFADQGDLGAGPGSNRGRFDAGRPIADDGDPFGHLHAPLACQCRCLVNPGRCRSGFLGALTPDCTGPGNRPIMEYITTTLPGSRVKGVLFWTDA